MISTKKEWNAGNNLLFHAITHGDANDVMALLEDKEANVNATNINGATPLHFAVYYQNKDIVEILLKYGANPNVQEYNDIGLCTPLHRAIERHNYELCRILLGNGADPNIADNSGFTALHLAARKGYEDIVKLLVDSGADVHKRDNYGYNASYWAKTMDFSKLLEILPPPAKRTLDELYEYRVIVNRVHEVPQPKGKKKKKKGKKK